MNTSKVTLRLIVGEECSFISKKNETVVHTVTRVVADITNVPFELVEEIINKLEPSLKYGHKLEWIP